MVGIPEVDLIEHERQKLGIEGEYRSLCSTNVLEEEPPEKMSKEDEGPSFYPPLPPALPFLPGFAPPMAGYPPIGSRFFSILDVSPFSFASGSYASTSRSPTVTPKATFPAYSSPGNAVKTQVPKVPKPTSGVNGVTVELIHPSDDLSLEELRAEVGRYKRLLEAACAPPPPPVCVPAQTPLAGAVAPKPRAGQNLTVGNGECVWMLFDSQDRVPMALLVLDSVFRQPMLLPIMLLVSIQIDSVLELSASQVYHPHLRLSRHGRECRRYAFDASLGNLTVSKPSCFLRVTWQLGTERVLQLNDSLIPNPLWWCNDHYSQWAFSAPLFVQRRARGLGFSRVVQSGDIDGKNTAHDDFRIVPDHTLVLCFVPSKCGFVLQDSSSFLIVLQNEELDSVHISCDCAVAQDQDADNVRQLALSMTSQTDLSESKGPSKRILLIAPSLFDRLLKLPSNLAEDGTSIKRIYFYGFGDTAFSQGRDEKLALKSKHPKTVGGARGLIIQYGRNTVKSQQGTGVTPSTSVIRGGSGIGTSQQLSTTRHTRRYVLVVSAYVSMQGGSDFGRFIRTYRQAAKTGIVFLVGGVNAIVVYLSTLESHLVGRLEVVDARPIDNAERLQLSSHHRLFWPAHTRCILAAHNYWSNIDPMRSLGQEPPVDNCNPRVLLLLRHNFVLVMLS
ncbi:hypothetical protein CLF_102987 [Clonorchis sinensis]|uniref:Uncharacterized protein n=1 Tax=Clonorchis sinensis TaxID=79923 RepID=G7YNB0_CLOSI|nr:hypothetical protein CLF_102987 [Clonorchis sinensis]